MTRNDAAKLKPGDRVYTSVGAGMCVDPLSAPTLKARLRLAEVVGLTMTVGGLAAWVRVRRVGFSRTGRRHPAIERRPDDLLSPAEYKAAGVGEPNLTPNVYADWLEERGHDAAARDLRQHFPLTEGGEE